MNARKNLRIDARETAERVSEDMPDRVSKDMPDRMPAKMSEDMPDRMPERVSKERPGRMQEIKGPDNPTCHILPIMSNKCCSGAGKEGKTKEVVEDREVKQIVCEELCVCVTKLYVKDGVSQSGVKHGVSKMVCQRWCVKDGV